MKEKIKKFWAWWNNPENHIGLIMLWAWFVIILAIYVVKGLFS